MRTARRTLVLAAITAVFVSAFAIPAMAAPAGQFISKINSSRAAAGLGPLESYWDLTDDARSHSNLMADRGEIFHSSTLGSVTSVWEKLGENVGVGLDVDSLHTAFMNSPGHRGNILGDYNYVGVGVTEGADGFIWVTVIFMKAAPGLNGGTTSTTVAPTTTTTPPPPSPPPAAGPVPAAQTAVQDKTPSTHQDFGEAVFTTEVSVQEQLRLEYPVFGKPIPPAFIV
jgi:Cysteine-rich secretory protein family